MEEKHCCTIFLNNSQLATVTVVFNYSNCFLTTNTWLYITSNIILDSCTPNCRAADATTSERMSGSLSQKTKLVKVQWTHHTPLADRPSASPHINSRVNSAHIAWAHFVFLLDLFFSYDMIRSIVCKKQTHTHTHRVISMQCHDPFN